MIEFGSCIVLIRLNSVCVIPVITGIHVKSFEKKLRWLQYLQEVILTMCFVGNLRISEASFVKLESFLCSWALPNLKCNCAVLYLKEIYWLFIMIPNILS